MAGSRVQINPAVLGQVKALFRDAFHAEMVSVSGVAREHCPVRTGFLRDSIGVAVVRSDQSGEVERLEATAPYAVPVEFGTSHSIAYPFLRPAMATFKVQHVADRAARIGGLRVTVSQATSLIGGDLGSSLGGELGEILGMAAGETLGPLGGTAGGYFGRRVGSHYGRHYGSQAGAYAGGVIYDHAPTRLLDITAIVADMVFNGQ